MSSAHKSTSAAQLDAIQHVRYVVGVASGPDDGGSLTVFLEKEEDAHSLAEVEYWSESTATPVTIKIIGPILL